MATPKKPALSAPAVEDLTVPAPDESAAVDEPARQALSLVLRQLAEREHDPERHRALDSALQSIDDEHRAHAKVRDAARSQSEVTGKRNKLEELLAAAEKLRTELGL